MQIKGESQRLGGLCLSQTHGSEQPFRPHKPNRGPCGNSELCPSSAGSQSADGADGPAETEPLLPHARTEKTSSKKPGVLTTLILSPSDEPWTRLCLSRWCHPSGNRVVCNEASHAATVRMDFAGSSCASADGRAYESLAAEPARHVRQSEGRVRFVILLGRHHRRT
jgi:hypothetical protein